MADPQRPPKIMSGEDVEVRRFKGQRDYPEPESSQPSAQDKFYLAAAELCLTATRYLDLLIVDLLIEDHEDAEDASIIRTR